MSASGTLWRKNNREHERLYSKNYKETHREVIKASTKAYRLKNRERIRIAAKRWRIENPEYRRNYAKRWRENNPDYERIYKRLAHAKNPLLQSLRNRLRQALKGLNKSNATLELLGCGIEDFRLHLESNWQPGMSWENYGHGAGKWGLDHLMPCAIFDLSKPEHQRRCFHFSNIRPMWYVANVKKGKKIVTNQYNLL